MNLSFVICGVEHSGTTLLSDLFRQVGGLESGFECGVLLCKSPRAFPRLHPFYENMLKGWMIEEAQLSACCQTDNFDEFYDRLAGGSALVNSSITSLFDKTPRYFSALSECLNKTSVPFLCTLKDPRSVVHSDMLRAKPANFEAWYERYAPKKQEYLARIYKESTKKGGDNSRRALIVRLEDICLNARETLDRAFAHVGLKFETRYLSIKERRYRHNRDSSIVANIPFEYRAGLTPAQIRRIEIDFSAFSDWFYE